MSNKEKRKGIDRDTETNNSLNIHLQIKRIILRIDKDVNLKKNHVILNHSTIHFQIVDSVRPLFL